MRDGKKLERNLRRELIADEELQEMLREHEIVDLAEVRRAYLEPDGQLTVIRNRRGGARDAAPASATKEIQEIHMAHANPIQIQKYLKGDYPADVSAAFKGPSQDHAERGDDDGSGRRRDH